MGCVKLRRKSIKERRGVNVDQRKEIKQVIVIRVENSNQEINKFLKFGLSGAKVHNWKRFGSLGVIVFNSHEGLRS